MLAPAKTTGSATGILPRCEGGPLAVPDEHKEGCRLSAYLDLDDVHIAAGPHGRRVDGTSLLEAAAWWAGEPHSDQPACVSATLAALVRGWAAALEDRPRQQLKAWVPKLATTGGDGGDPARALLLADWLTRTAAPAFLAAADLQDEAGRLRRAPGLDGWEQTVGILPTVGLAARAAGTRLEGAWATRGNRPNTDHEDAPQAAHQATSLAGATPAAAALGIALGDPGRTDLQGWLVAALRGVLGGHPAETVEAALDGVCRVALHTIRTAALDAVNGAALAAALTAPPDGAWAALEPTVRHLQATIDGLLERLCAAGKVTVH